MLVLSCTTTTDSAGGYPLIPYLPCSLVTPESVSTYRNTDDPTVRPPYWNSRSPNSRNLVFPTYSMATLSRGLSARLYRLHVRKTSQHFQRQLAIPLPAHQLHLLRHLDHLAPVSQRQRIPGHPLFPQVREE